MTKFLTYFFAVLSFTVVAQTTDSTRVLIDSTPVVSTKKDKKKESIVHNDPNHSPKKAAMYSTVLPGLGQAYNRKYWKIPIVYAALGGVGYLAYTNTIYYNFWHNGLILKNAMTYGTKTQSDFDYFINTDPHRTFATGYTNDQLTSLTESDFQVQNNYYRRNRDLSFFFLGMLYMMNILDATVDGHLYNFNISDDLSFHVQPSILNYGLYNTSTMGMQLSLKF